jgi:hypothetical protein
LQLGRFPGGHRPDGARVDEDRPALVLAHVLRVEVDGPVTRLLDRGLELGSVLAVILDVADPVDLGEGLDLERADPLDVLVAWSISGMSARSPARPTRTIWPSVVSYTKAWFGLPIGFASSGTALASSGYSFAARISSRSGLPPASSSGCRSKTSLPETASW